MENEVWEKTAQFLNQLRGRAVIKGIICPNAGTGKKAEASGKTYGRVQGNIKKHVFVMVAIVITNFPESYRTVTFLKDCGKNDLL